jgi:hypothetical protein
MQSCDWPSRFLDLKREIVSATTEDRLTASWNDLLNELAQRTAEIAQEGPDVSGLFKMCAVIVLTTFDSSFLRSPLQTWRS